MSSIQNAEDLSHKCTHTLFKKRTNIFTCDINCIVLAWLDVYLGDSEFPHQGGHEHVQTILPTTVNIFQRKEYKTFHGGIMKCIVVSEQLSECK